VAGDGLASEQEVSAVASAHRAEPVRLRSAPLRAAVPVDEYVGRHRRSQPRAFSLRRLFYVARHRRR
jgi:hypothetical protein